VSTAPDLQLLLAIAIVVASLGLFGWVIWSKVRAVGFLRSDFDRRAPWIALGVILGGVAYYYMKAGR
jgi:hypothetical protein